MTLQSSIQEAIINAGDYIIADQDGVVCLPADLADDVLEAIPAIAAADEKCAEAIRGGMSVQEAFATYRGKKWIWGYIKSLRLENQDKYYVDQQDYVGMT